MVSLKIFFSRFVRTRRLSCNTCNLTDNREVERAQDDVMDKTIKYKDDDGNEKEATVGGILKQGKDHPGYKEYCKRQGYVYVSNNKSKSTAKLNVSNQEITTYFSLEKDEAIKQIVSLSKNQLSTEEGEIVYLSQLILDHAKSTGVDKKRKFYSRLEQYVGNTQESIKKLKSGKSRSEARTSSRLKTLKKHSEQYLFTYSVHIESSIFHIMCMTHATFLV